MQASLTTRLGIDQPIILAPLAGGPSTPALAAAVTQAGGLGMLGAAYLSPTAIRAELAEMQRLTDRPWGVNLFVPATPVVDQAIVTQTQVLLDTYRAELGIPLSPPLPALAESFAAQLAVVLAARVPVFSFTFGIMAPEVIAALHAQGTFVIGTATTVAEGMALAAAGVDAVVGQGSEAGGHRGVFDSGQDEGAQIGTLALIPQLVDALPIPVIASGGIMDGRGVVAALALGASAVQMGTAFLVSPESGANPAYKAAVLASKDAQTVITRVFSGRPARGLANRFAREMADLANELPPFPVLNAMTRDIRQAAAKQGRAEYLSLWAGQASALATARPAGDIVREIMEQVAQICQQLGSGNISSNLAK